MRRSIDKDHGELPSVVRNLVWLCRLENWKKSPILAVAAFAVLVVAAVLTISQLVGPDDAQVNSLEQERITLSAEIYEIEYFLTGCWEEIQVDIQLGKIESAGAKAETCSRGVLDEDTSMAVELGRLEDRVLSTFAGDDQITQIDRLNKLRDTLMSIRIAGIRTEQ